MADSRINDISEKGPIGKNPRSRAGSLISRLLTRKNLRYLPLVFVAVAGMILSATLFSQGRKNEYQRMRNEFISESRDHIAILKKEIELHLEKVEAIRDFYAGSILVERDEFQQFTESFLKKHNDIACFMWIPRVTALQRGPYEDAVRSEGFSNFQIREINSQDDFVAAADRDEYWPIDFTVPQSEAIMGLDISVVPEMFEPFALSRDTAQITGGGELELLADYFGPQTVLVVIPIYRQEASLDTIEQRRQNLQGFVAAIIVVSSTLEMAKEVLQPAGIDFYLYDNTSPEKRSFLLLHKSRLQEDSHQLIPQEQDVSKKGLYYEETIDFAGRKWLIQSLPCAEYTSRIYSIHPWMNLLLGLLLTTMLVGYVYREISSKERIQQTVDKQTAELRRSEEFMRISEERFRTLVANIPGVVYRCKLDEYWTMSYMSEMIEKISGYPASDFIENQVRSFASIIHPEDRQMARDITFERVEKGRSFSLEYRIITSDGDTKWLFERGRGIQDENGEVLFLDGALFDISNRKHAEQALAKSSERLSMALDAANDGLWDWNIEKGEVYFSPRYYTMLEYEPNEFPASFEAWADLIHPDAKEAAVEKICEHIERRSETFTDEYRLRTKTGRWRWILSRGKVVERDENGESVRMVGTHVDITERKLAEESLLAEKLLSEDYINSLPGLFYVFDEQRFVRWNKMWGKVTGYSDEELGTKYGPDFFEGEGRKYIEEKMRQVFREGISEAEAELVTKDGRRIPYYFSGLRTKINGKAHLVGFGIDITERKQAEDALRESEMMNRSLLEGSPVCNKIIDLDFKLRYMSAAGIKDLKISDIKPYYGQAYPPTFFPESMRAPLIEGLKSAMAGKITSLEVPVHDMEGDVVWYHTTFVPVLDDDGRVKYIIGSSMNITERKLAEQKIANLARFPSENPNPVLRVSTEGVILYANQSSEPLLRTWQSAIGECIPDKWYQIVMDTLACRQPRQAETECDQMILSLMFAPVAESNYVNVYAMDITELRHAEKHSEELLRILALKNEELESIVYVSSHDLRSPLVNIQGFSGELGQSCAELTEAISKANVPTELQETIDRLLQKDIPMSLEFVQKNTDKINVLINSLLKLSRIGQTTLDIRLVDMNNLIARIWRNMEYQVTKSGAKVIIDELPPCMADSVQITHVFTNLIDNALKFLYPERQGLIRISGTVEGDSSIYCVEDNGIGINPEYRGKIFEIFNRFEPRASEGQGLGLTIAKRIVGMHNGRIWVESELGKGSRFYVALPATQCTL